MDMSKVLVDLGYAYDSMMGHDMFNPVHLRFTVTLDHDVNDKFIKEAWDRTKRVYPIIESVVGLDHGDPRNYLSQEAKEKYRLDHIYLMKPDSGVNDPIKSKIPVTPGTDIVGNRLISISYYGNTVSISAYHTFVDGGGLNKVFSTFLYSYLALYTGHEDEHPVVDLEEGRNIEEYYTSPLMDIVFSQEYTPVPVYSLPKNCKGFHDVDMVNDEHAYVGSIDIPADEWIGFCKKNGANPSSMLCLLGAKAAYALNPEEQMDIVFELTVSIRHLLGIEKSISNAIGLAYAYTTRDDIMHKTVAEVSQKIRKDVETQRTKDYCISFSRFFNTYQHSPKFTPRVITYIGKMNIGDNNHHIVDFNMETYGHRVLYLMQLNDRFKFIVQYGKATEKYLDAFMNIFTEYGIKAELSHPFHQVLNDSKTAVL